MNDIAIEFDETEEHSLAYEISDEALEGAARPMKDKAGSFTLSFCSNGATCPS